MKKLLYVCEADSGGIMEYALRQAAAIALQGREVHFLCKESFPKHRLAAGIRIINFEAGREPSWSQGKLRTIWRLTIGSRRISKQIFEIAKKMHFEFVLFACFKEYFSPFWVGPLKRLAKRGVVIGAIAHDPIRDFVVGPLWWHRWSVRLAYSFVSHVFVHDNTVVDFGGRQPERIQVHRIPHGPYEVSEPKIGRPEMRRRLGFDSVLTTIEHGGRCEMEQSKVGPKGERVGTIESKSTELEAGPCLAGQAGASESDSLASELAESPNFKSLTRCASGLASSPATRQSSLATEPEVPSPAASRSSLATPDSQDIVFLAFGQIRDGKNLDLFLQVMPNLPDNVKLLVAGMGDSGSSKSPNYYQRLAEELGVANRCRWDVRRIPEGELGDFFEACDVVLLTYSAKFRSASGVLNTAVSARKPVLASSGPGPLKNAVNKYHLGVFVEPDNPEEVLRGAKQLLDSLSPPATHKLAARRSTLDACFPPANIDSPHDTAGVFLTAWDLYEKENSWEKNALGVTVAF